MLKKKLFNIPLLSNLAGNVQPLVDHLQLPDLLPIQPNDLGKVFAPEIYKYIRAISFPVTNIVSIILNVTGRRRP